jgi:predicted adenylyl cyclase CyaB
MPIELEAKIKVDDLNTVRTRLQSAGAQPLGQYHEINRFFDTTPPTLRPEDRGQRLRTSRDTQTGQTTHTLTYKGPRHAGQLKQREEIELPLPDPTAAELLLNRLGFARGLVFEKRRESWQLNDCRVELDEVAELGCFVEVEGPQEEAIHAVLETLGLEKAKLIRESYPQLLDS